MSIYQFLSKNTLFLVELLILLLVIIFYPIRYVTIDEKNYQQIASAAINGDVRVECLATDQSLFHVDKYCVHKYNIGTSILLIPSVFLGQKYVFVTTFLAYGAFLAVLHYVSRKLGHRPILFWLAGLFPLFIYLSRTILSETYSMLFLLGSFCALLEWKSKKKWWILFLGGILAGFSILIKYSNLLIVAGFYLPLFVGEVIKNKKKILEIIKKWIPFAISVGIFLAIIILINTYLYGHPLRSGYYYSGEEGVYSITQAPMCLLVFFGILNLIYPGMFISAFLSKSKYKWSVIISTVLLLIFYAGFPGNSTFFKGKIYDVILGARYFAPVMPFLLLMYLEFLSQFKENKFYKIAIIGSIVVLIINAFLISYFHQEFLLAVEDF